MYPFASGSRPLPQCRRAAPADSRRGRTQWEQVEQFMRRSRRALLTILSAVGLGLVLSLPASAGTWHPHPTPYRPSPVRPHQTGNSSYPDFLAPHGHFLYFEADMATTKGDLMRSDGTAGGTHDIYDDVDPEYLTWAGNKLFFVGYDPTFGTELWISDGTHLNTEMITDSVTSGDARIDGLTAVGDKVFYEEDDGVHGWEPWVSDGTPHGTHMLKNIMPGAGDSDPSGFTAVGGAAIFAATDANHGRELFRSDGTSAGTKLLMDIRPGHFSSYPYWFAPIAGKVVFAAFDGVHGDEPWITDGTAQGTHLLKDVAPGTLDGIWSGAYTPQFTRFGNKLFFEANDGIHNWELWKTDGTKAGTKLAVDVWPGPRSGDPWQTTSNGQHLIMVAADEAHGYELWRTDGNQATLSFVKDIYPGDGDSNVYLAPGDVAHVGHKVIFSADDGTHGPEPWVTDGTHAGTHLLMDINPGLEPSDASRFANVQTAAGPRGFFVAYSPTYGTELWVTDGTPGGTSVIDIYP
jgi:ELWxxDGT repeat protein